MLLIVGILIMKGRQKKEGREGDDEDEVGGSEERPGLSEGLAARMLSGPPTQSDLPPVMRGQDELPSVATTPDQQGQLPPASMETVAGPETGYIRPTGAGPLKREGFKAPPPGGTGPIGTEGPPVSGIPTEDRVKTELMDLLTIQDPSDIKVRPAEEFGISIEEDKNVWTPQMVESRTAAEAKSALEMLHELNELRNEGAITEEEYEISKKRLLRKI
jgi:hypothetical protein